MFQKKLKEVRIQKELSQEDLAQSLYITRQTISKWERGLSLPDVDQLSKLSKQLDIPVDELLNEDMEHCATIEIKRKQHMQKYMKILLLTISAFLIIFLFIMGWMTFFGSIQYQDDSNVKVEITPITKE